MKLPNTVGVSEWYTAKGFTLQIIISITTQQKNLSQAYVLAVLFPIIAIQESLSSNPAPPLISSPMDDYRTSEESQLEIALKLSQQAQEDEEKQLREEQEMLERALQLSLAEQ
ncbi:hypothetical protein AVEN_105999-1 [Araneus ventricosus]|uniref:Uncharacterized protein n=1 Tax=Araneus ventricosus TaxID=182803 RepID=A0A4Y2RV51_ARAVE|nr:hypothetical protein AVEN_105999-1 [Araneus ventricosus]